jgi:radical SAM superfamily enzyme YgiQ (UPF0313 family)
MFNRILLVKPRGRKGLGYASDVIPIGLEYIAGAIQDKVEDVNIIDLELEQAPIGQFINIFKPDLVGATVSAADYYEALEIARASKEYGCTTVLGGYHATADPEGLLSHHQVDLVVRGEGEHTMRELVQKGSPQGILGLSYKEGRAIIHNGDRPLIEDLDLLPFPARHLRRHRYEDHLPIDGDRERDVISMSRGCVGRCVFCCEPGMSRGQQRFRSPENVMAELQEVAAYHGGKPLYLFVSDPNFMGSPTRIARLCSLLNEHKLDIRFSVLARVDSVVRNATLVREMCQNGILNYELGIESPKAEDLKGTRKGITLDMQEKAVRILREHGAWVGGTFVIGLPGQTEDQIRKFPLYAKRMGLTGAGFGVATPFPGTEFYDTLKQNGVALETDWTKYDEMHSVYESGNLSRERLEQLAAYCHAEFWTLDALIERARTSTPPGEKIQIEDFIKSLIGVLKFAWNTTSDLESDSLITYMRTAAEAGADPSVEDYTRKVGLDNVIEFPRLLLKVLGTQRIQFTIKCEEEPITSYVLETTRGTVEYVKALPGRVEDATINLDFDLKYLDLSKANDSATELLKNCIRATVSLRGIDEIWGRLRLLAAIGLESTYQIMYQTIRAIDR